MWLKTSRIMSLIVPTVLVLGCQSTDSKHSSNQAVVSKMDTTEHISSSLYQVQFQSAVKLNEQAISLNKSMKSFCSNGADLSDLKRYWQASMAAWMHLQGQERGPVKALEQSWNVQFWPDKKNTTGRKMSQLVSYDKSWTAEEISNQSVTVQGLGAIEWMLYDAQSPLLTNKGETCSSATAISQNLQNRTSQIRQAWLINPWTSMNEAQWNSEYVSLLSNQLEYSMKKLSRPLAKMGHPRAYFSESWRSASSLSNLKENLKAMQAIYFANGSGLDAILRARDKGELADRITLQFDMAIDTWPEQDSLFNMLQTKSGYQNVLAQYNKLEQLKYLIHEEVAIELGVVIGFNATDGD
ncbi:imelysin family protein [Vibrio sp. 03-59-1]|uniref:imelysin family protein n=1 Tax=Vibrio sp. 03-59-1 TaxID=2607607 RepID=UPI001493C4C6|nr:imelysin family protein [Vibrio sp. 03-59-1]NOH83941.1 imelysin family protein [Vibrio sp. 03-59-1]